MNAPPYNPWQVRYHQLLASTFPVSLGSGRNRLSVFLCDNPCLLWLGVTGDSYLASWVTAFDARRVTPLHH